MRSSVPYLVFLMGGALAFFLWPDRKPTPVPVRSTEVALSRPNVLKVPEESRDHLAAFRQAYETEASPAKLIRVQARLAETPQLDRLMLEVADREAPVAYRSYLARVLRNEAKRESAHFEKFGNALRAVVADATETFAARAEIARALIAIDPSPELIRVLGALLDEATCDEEADAVIGTLARSSRPEASAILWRFVESHHADYEAYPKALSAALLPLSQVEGIPLTGILSRLQDQVADPVLLASVTRTLTARHHRE